METTATITMAITTRPQQQDHDNKTTTRYNNQLNGGPLAVECDDDNNNDGDSNGKGNGDGEGDGDSEGNSGSTRCKDNYNNSNNNPLPVVVDVVIIQCLCLCCAVTTQRWQDGKVVAVIGKGGTTTATVLAAMTTTSTMTTTIPCPSLLMSSSLDSSVFAALDQQWQWDGNRVPVVDKVGRTAVGRDKCDGATCCDNDDNHPYPVIADVVIIWRLPLHGNRIVMAAARWQQGGKDRGSGHHSPAVVGRGS